MVQKVIQISFISLVCLSSLVSSVMFDLDTLTFIFTGIAALLGIILSKNGTIKIRTADILFTIALTYGLVNQQTFNLDIVIKYTVFLCIWFYAKLTNSTQLRKWFVFAIVFTAVIHTLAAIMQLFHLLPNQNSFFTATALFDNPGPYGCYISFALAIYNPEGLTQSALNAVNAIIEDDNKNNPGKKTAKCNKGVQEAFKNYIGELPSYMINRANEMIEAWKTRPNEWVQIKESDYGNRQEWLNAIQDMANQGYFVVSGWINHETYTDTNGNVIRKSGHVTVIVPSDGSPMGYSGTWSCNVPYTMDTGVDKRYIKAKISVSYGSDKIESVVFYYYKYN